MFIFQTILKKIFNVWLLCYSVLVCNNGTFISLISSFQKRNTWTVNYDPF